MGWSVDDIIAEAARLPLRDEYGGAAARYLETKHRDACNGFA